MRPFARRGLNRVAFAMSLRRKALWKSRHFRFFSWGMTWAEAVPSILPTFLISMRTWFPGRAPAAADRRCRLQGAELGEPEMLQKQKLASECGFLAIGSDPAAW
jgi:hypothetical protein